MKKGNIDKLRPRSCFHGILVLVHWSEIPFQNGSQDTHAQILAMFNDAKADLIVFSFRLYSCYWLCLLCFHILVSLYLTMMDKLLFVRLMVSTHRWSSVFVIGYSMWQTNKLGFVDKTLSIFIYIFFKLLLGVSFSLESSFFTLRKCIKRQKKKIIMTIT